MLIIKLWTLNLSSLKFSLDLEKLTSDGKKNFFLRTTFLLYKHGISHETWCLLAGPFFIQKILTYPTPTLFYFDHQSNYKPTWTLLLALRDGCGHIESASFSSQDVSSQRQSIINFIIDNRNVLAFSDRQSIVGDNRSITMHNYIWCWTTV